MVMTAIDERGPVCTVVDSWLHHSVPRTPTTSVIDTPGGVAGFTSLTIGVDGLALVSYYDSAGDRLRVARCLDVRCTTSTVALTTEAGTGGRWSSIGIGADGRPLVAYSGGDDGGVWLLRCLDLPCTSAQTVPLDAAVDEANDVSIGIDPHGNPVISYIDEWNEELDAAICRDPRCDQVDIRPMSSGYSILRAGEMTQDAEGNLLVSALDGEDIYDQNPLVFACPYSPGSITTSCGWDWASGLQCYQGAACPDLSRVKYADARTSAGGWTVIAALAYEGDQPYLVVHRCLPECFGRHDLTVIRLWSSIEYEDFHLGFDAQDRPVFLLYDLRQDTDPYAVTYTGSLHAFTCVDALCKAPGATDLYDVATEQETLFHGVIDGGFQVEGPDGIREVHDVGMGASIALGADGLPIVSYLDRTDGSLKATHLGAAHGWLGVNDSFGPAGHVWRR